MCYFCITFDSSNSETMTTKELTNEIKKLAIETNVSFVQACQAMQSVAAKMGNEEMIQSIHKIKMASLK